MRRAIRLPRGIWGDVMRGADNEHNEGICATLVKALNEDEAIPKWRSARAEGRFVQTDRADESDQALTEAGDRLFFLSQGYRKKISEFLFFILTYILSVL